ncbi:hypothetical protein GOBAR_AA34300 [Gossypium barbadense]|uniref:DUF4283 domain-containing protein n=1 Tax=Gossypium barbadense TaxID=3634 RepID=A0A2P5W5N0_GOSBA|nr:hypothetical protein GOBAR_AA34300 [Gossypium barbadense]
MGHQSLDYFPHSVCEGEIIVKPLDKAFEERTRRWQQSLVAQIIGKAPNFRDSLFIFQFSSANAYDWVLENGLWHIQNKPLILQSGSLKGLSYIASAIGSHWYMGRITASRSHLAFAKVCVKVPIDVLPVSALEKGKVIRVSHAPPVKKQVYFACFNNMFDILNVELPKVSDVFIDNPVVFGSMSNGSDLVDVDPGFVASLNGHVANATKMDTYGYLRPHRESVKGGLNNPNKLRKVLNRVKKLNVGILCLLETRVKEDKSVEIIYKYFRSWSITCNYREASNGRIWMLARQGISLTVLKVTD